MIVNIQNLNKSIGLKVLYDDLNMIIRKGNKSALIGRNGTGKTTLFKLITGEDKDFDGNIEVARDTRIIKTEQEHLEASISKDTTPLDYILDSVPRYEQLRKIIKNSEQEGIYDDKYLNAIGDFTDLGYFSIEEDIIKTLSSFQIDEEQAISPLLNLSGGEKRFVELTRVMFSQADLALIDEPTNHMDSVGKEMFINWLLSSKQSMLIITHDRDVLHSIDKIYELNNQKVQEYDGNYEEYLKINSTNTVADINAYQNDVRKLDKLKKQFDAATEAKITAKSNKGRLAKKILAERIKREYNKVKENVAKPSFWIDQETVEDMPDKIKETYEKYKTENIKITDQKENEQKIYSKLLVKTEQFTLGYNKQLFEPISFELYNLDNLRIKGRNGVGKTTLLKYLRTLLEENFNADAKKFSGEIFIKNKITLGVYEQEIQGKYLKLTLKDATAQLLKENGKPVNDTSINGILKRYLFDLNLHRSTILKDLSGGEKARFQIIKMLINEPNLLILDEPTNHLDLPSIEELENFLVDYVGAIIYVSHDSYFAKNMGGDEIRLEKV